MMPVSYLCAAMRKLVLNELSKMFSLFQNACRKINRMIMVIEKNETTIGLYKHKCATFAVMQGK